MLVGDSMKCLLLSFVIVISITACVPVLKPKTMDIEIDIELKADEFCNGEDVDYVYICNNEYIKVVSSLLEGGSALYRKDMTNVHCPIIDPDAMNKECKKLIYESECKRIC